MTEDLRSLISTTVRNMPPSGIRKFFDIVSEMKDAISLGVGEPDFVTPWIIREAGIASLEDGHTYYTSNAGMMELRKEISRFFKRKYDLNYSSGEQVLVTVGGSEAIDLAVRALVNVGEEVLIPEPSFVCYKPITLLAGGIPVPIVTLEENQFRLTAEQLKRHITPKTKALILPYPSNPTGAVMDCEDLEEIAECLRGTDIIVISDEIYADLTYNGQHCSIAQLRGMYDRTVVVTGFSKSYAMTGWRLGYAAGRAEFIGAMTKVHQYAIMSAPTMAQYAAIEALRSCDEHVAAMRDEYDMRRKVMVNGFREMGLSCFEPQGAFYVFPSIRETGMTSEQFASELLKEEKVAVVPGVAFGECGEGFIRCSYAYSIENIQEALKRIKNFVEKKMM